MPEDGRGGSPRGGSPGVDVTMTGRCISTACTDRALPPFASFPTTSIRNRSAVRSLRSLRGLGLVLLLAACGAEPIPERTEAVVRDSAGVTIIENTVPQWTAETAWRVAPQPTVTIGELEGAEEYLLFRVYTAKRLANGHIVLTNAGTNELRFYDADGVHVRTVGGEGEGPAEFRFLMDVSQAGDDSIIAFDISLRRFSLWDISGEFGRMLPYGTKLAGFPQLTGHLADGSPIVYMAEIAGREEPGTYEDHMWVYRIHMDGEKIDTIGRFQGSELMTVRFGRGGRLLGTSFVLPFARDPIVLGAGTGIYYGTRERYDIGFYGLDGQLVKSIRRLVPPRHVTDEERDLILNPPDEGRTEIPRSVLESGVDVPIGETMPAYAQLLVDDVGNLWVEDYEDLWSELDSWAVFDTVGIYLGTVQLPAGCRLKQVGEEFILGVWIGEFDEGQVRMYELVKP